MGQPFQAQLTLWSPVLVSSEGRSLLVTGASVGPEPSGGLKESGSWNCSGSVDKCTNPRWTVWETPGGSHGLLLGVSALLGSSPGEDSEDEIVGQAASPSSFYRWLQVQLTTDSCELLPRKANSEHRACAAAGLCEFFSSFLTRCLSNAPFIALSCSFLSFSHSGTLGEILLVRRDSQSWAMLPILSLFALDLGFLLALPIIMTL